MKFRIVTASLILGLGSQALADQHEGAEGKVYSGGGEWKSSSDGTNGTWTGTMTFMKEEQGYLVTDTIMVEKGEESSEETMQLRFIKSGDAGFFTVEGASAEGEFAEIGTGYCWMMSPDKKDKGDHGKDGKDDKGKDKDKGKGKNDGNTGDEGDDLRGGMKKKCHFTWQDAQSRGEESWTFKGKKLYRMGSMWGEESGWIAWYGKFSMSGGSCGEKEKPGRSCDAEGMDCCCKGEEGGSGCPVDDAA